LSGGWTDELSGRLPRLLGARHAALLGSALLAVLTAWAASTQIDVVVTAPATARLLRGPAEIRAPEARSVHRVVVDEGSRVAAGQVIIELDLQASDRRWRAAATALADRRRLLASDRALLGVLGGTLSSTMPDAAQARLAEHRSRLQRLSWEAEAVAAETAALEVRVTAAQRQRNIAAARFRAVDGAAERGAMSEFDRLRARQDLWQREDQLNVAVAGLEVLRSRLASQRHAHAEADAGFRRSLLESVDAARAELAELEARLAAAAEQRRRSQVISPMAGIVDRLDVAAGDVVERGEILAVVVPEAVGVLFEARILPAQMAFLHPGQACRLKLDALPFARYGALACRVERLGRDAVDDGSNAYFTASLRPAATVVEADGTAVSLQSGATAWVDIVAGRRTVLGFVTEPLQRFAGEALRER